jgi:hypothetical protein
MVPSLRRSFDNKGDRGIDGRRHVSLEIYTLQGEMVSLASNATVFFPSISALEISSYCSLSHHDNTPFRHNFNNEGDRAKETALASPTNGMYLSKYTSQGEMLSLASDAAVFFPLISALETSPYCSLSVVVMDFVGVSDSSPWRPCILYFNYRLICIAWACTCANAVSSIPTTNIKIDFTAMK